NLHRAAGGRHDNLPAGPRANVSGQELLPAVAYLQAGFVDDSGGQGAGAAAAWECAEVGSVRAFRVVKDVQLAVNKLDAQRWLRRVVLIREDDLRQRILLDAVRINAAAGAESQRLHSASVIEKLPRYWRSLADVSKCDQLMSLSKYP